MMGRSNQGTMKCVPSSYTSSLMPPSRLNTIALRAGRAGSRGGWAGRQRRRQAAAAASKGCFWTARRCPRAASGCAHELPITATARPPVAGAWGGRPHGGHAPPTPTAGCRVPPAQIGPPRGACSPPVTTLHVKKAVCEAVDRRAAEQQHTGQPARCRAARRHLDVLHVLHPAARRCCWGPGCLPAAGAPPGKQTRKNRCRGQRRGRRIGARRPGRPCMGPRLCQLTAVSPHRWPQRRSQPIPAPRTPPPTA